MQGGCRPVNDAHWVFTFHLGISACEASTSWDVDARCLTGVERHGSLHSWRHRPAGDDEQSFIREFVNGQGEGLQVEAEHGTGPRSLSVLRVKRRVKCDGVNREYLIGLRLSTLARVDMAMTHVAPTLSPNDICCSVQCNYPIR